MPFTSFAFFGLFPAVMILWYLLPHRPRKVLLLCAGYAFYMWSVPMLGLVLLGTTALSYGAGRLLDSPRLDENRRVWVLTVSCLLHFGLLFLFQYLRKQFELWSGLLPAILPQSVDPLILPLGLSFYTLAETGYLFDVYRHKLPAERNILDYALFTAFFPCMLAGPVGQARSFLPQLKEPVPFRADRVKAGVLRFVFGLFQKLVLADHIAVAVDAAYGGEVLSPLTWIAVILLFGLQIYFALSGYSHMAIGIATALGLRVRENFNAPYLSCSVSGFWKRWHISLTDWFREYLYLPLGGGQKGRLRGCLALLATFTGLALWHGPSLHLLLWGLYNAALLMLERVFGTSGDRPRVRRERPVGTAVWKLFRGLGTYLLVSFGWVLFRVEGLAKLRFLLGQLLGLFRTGFGPLQVEALGVSGALAIVLALCLLLCAVVDALWLRGHRMQGLIRSVLPYYAALSALILLTAVFGVYGEGVDHWNFILFKG